MENMELLSEEETRKLFLRLKNGDEAARLELIKRNLKLVSFVVRKFENVGIIDNEDLFQEGCIGLIIAIDKFDVERGTKLSTYAVKWIFERIGRCLSNNARSIRIPVPRIDKMKSVNSAINYLTGVLKRNPTNLEIAKFLGLSEKEVVSIIQTERSFVSYDASYAEYRKLYSEILPNEDMSVEDIVVLTELEDIVQKWMDDAKLTKNQKKVIDKYYGLDGNGGYNLTEIAEINGSSRQYCFQARNNALEKLKKCKKINKLDSYLDDVVKKSEEEEFKINDCEALPLSKDEYMDIKNSLTFEELEEILNNFTVNEETVILLKLGYNNGLCFEDSQIASYLNMDEEEVKKILGKFLAIYTMKMEKSPKILNKR